MLEQERSGEDILTDLFGTPELGSELFDINLECLEHSGGSRDDGRLSHSSLTRSHSMNAVHEIGLQESRESVEFDSFSSRPQSAFPSIFPSSTCTAAPVDLRCVSQEMPMYLLEEDEGNDEEIMKLLDDVKKSDDTSTSVKEEQLVTSSTHKVTDVPTNIPVYPATTISRDNFNSSTSTSIVISNHTSVPMETDIIQSGCDPTLEEVMKSITTGDIEDMMERNEVLNSIVSQPSQRVILKARTKIMDLLSKDKRFRRQSSAPPSGPHTNTSFSCVSSPVITKLTSSTSVSLPVNISIPLESFLEVVQDNSSVISSSSPKTATANSTPSCNNTPTSSELAPSPFNSSSSPSTHDESSVCSSTDSRKDLTISPTNSDHLEIQDTLAVKQLIKLHSTGTIPVDSMDNESVKRENRKIKRRHKGGWTKGKRRKTDLERLKPPKPPVTSFGAFLREKCPQMISQNGKKSMSVVSKRLGQLWGTMSTKMKAEYQIKAEDDRKRFTDELKEYLERKYEGLSNPSTQAAIEALINASFHCVDNDDILHCDVCGLKFFNSSSKQAHFCGRPHTRELIKKVEEVGKERTDDPSKFRLNERVVDELKRKVLKKMQKQTKSVHETKPNEVTMETGSDREEGGLQVSVEEYDKGDEHSVTREHECVSVLGVEEQCIEEDRLQSDGDKIETTAIRVVETNKEEGMDYEEEYTKGDEHSVTREHNKCVSVEQLHVLDVNTSIEKDRLESGGEKIEAKGDEYSVTRECVSVEEQLHVLDVKTSIEKDRLESDGVQIETRAEEANRHFETNKKKCTDCMYKEEYRCCDVFSEGFDQFISDTRASGQSLKEEEKLNVKLTEENYHFIEEISDLEYLQEIYKEIVIESQEEESIFKESIITLTNHLDEVFPDHLNYT